jgi:hypothetical protein
VCHSWFAHLQAWKPAPVPGDKDHVAVAMDHLLAAGLDLNRVLARLDAHDAAAGRIRAALGRIDKTVDELRHAALLREVITAR